jgi:hypothetical protein
MTGIRANPFSLRGALLLVAGGTALFVALAWMIGAGLSGGSVNDGGGHGGGKGLNGFAGFARLIEAQGRTVYRARSESGLDAPSIAVLTPPHFVDTTALDRILVERRRNGPTLLILPKWQALSIPANARPPNAKPGWVMLGNAQTAHWAGDLAASGRLDTRIGAGSGRWSGLGANGSLPDASAIQTISSDRLATLVDDGRGQTLAALLDDGNDYGALSRAASGTRAARIAGSRLYPLVVIAEPDLLDNYGLAREENARLALALIAAMDESGRLPVTFDLTLNGHARSANLLTLAFTPPFLAATLCLLLAALVIGWRAFLRFGPPRTAGRAIAFGKRALVANSAGFVRRTRRLHLVTVPYADRARATLTRTLGLARQPSIEDAELAIDRALASRAPDMAPFSRIAGRLRGATGTAQAVTAARELHALERKLKR